MLDNRGSLILLVIERLAEICSYLFNTFYYFDSTKLQKSHNNKPCMNKLLRLDEHFRVSALDFFCLSVILTLP